MVNLLTKLTKAKDLPITMRQERWLSLPENQRPFSTAALQHAQQALSREIGGKRSRKTPYRASGSGGCTRRRHFAAEGVIENENLDSRLNSIFMTGDFGHLKWQMMGLTEGWLIEAEIPVETEDHLLSGTMDGRIYDGSIFEFKTINDNGFREVVTYGPTKSHLRQTHAYMLCSDTDKVSIVYENKNDQDWIECRVDRDEAMITAIEDEIDELNDQYNEKRLREPLSDCQLKTGSIYRQCPFRDVCLNIYKWSDINDHKNPALGAA
jgi:hypothetical protein